MPAIDPNSTIGTPVEREVWLLPDWSGYVAATRPKPANATKVSIRDVTYGDGRVVTYVLDENRRPITTQVLEQTTDDAQAKRYADALRQEGTRAKNVTRKYPGTDPQTGQPALVTEYEDGSKDYDATPRAGVTDDDTGFRTEGTPTGRIGPDGTPEYDNQRPRKVWHNPDGSIRKVGALSPTEHRDWLDDQERSRNEARGLGRKTDEDVRKDAAEGRAQATHATQQAAAAVATTKAAIELAPGSVRVPVQGHPGISLVTTENPQTKQKESHYENEARQTVPQPADAPTYQVSSAEINGQKYFTVWSIPKDGTPPSMTHYGPDGQPVSALPRAGVGNRPDLPTYTPDLTRPGLGLHDYARSLDQYMRDHPDFTYEQRQEVLKAAQAEGKSVADEFNLGASILREQYTTGITQRGQDITRANSQAALANQHMQNALGMIEKFSPYLGQVEGNAGKLFMGLMASQLATATAYGGMQQFPREQLDPRLTAFADRAVSGTGYGAPPPGPAATAAPGAPVAPGMAPPGGPNALGLGAIGAVDAVDGRYSAPAPGLPPPVFQPPPPVGSIAPVAPGGMGAPTAGEPGGPPLASGPVFEWPGGGPPTAGEPGGPPLAPGPVLGSPPPAGAPARDDWRLPPVTDAPPGLQGLADRAIPAAPVAFSGDPAPLEGFARRQIAQDQADYLTGTTAPQPGVAGLFGPGPTAGPFGGPGMDLGTGLGLPALDAGSAGFNPDIDAEARRQLMLEGIG